MCPTMHPNHSGICGRTLVIHVLDPRTRMYLLPLLGSDSNGQLHSIYAFQLSYRDFLEFFISHLVPQANAYRATLNFLGL